MPPDVPQNPPLELVKQQSLWVVEEYRQGARTGRTFASHDSQMGALRHAKSKMEADRHPCIVRWNSPDSVGAVFWNPLFECLAVKPDELVDGWTVVPREGTCAMTVADSRSEAAERGRELQRLYDFRHLRVYDGHDEAYEQRDHRFLRYDITRSGVRFNPDAVAKVPDPDEADETPDTDRPAPPQSTDADQSEPTDIGTVGPVNPGQLGASIPDVTKVEFTDTDGAVHRYSTPWAGGTRAQIITLSRKHATDDGAPEAFAEMLGHWRECSGEPHVATIYESGTDPTSWAAYRVGDHTLADIGTGLPARSRIEILGGIVEAVGSVGGTGTPVCGIRPKNVHLLERDGDRRTTVANWGIEWAVRNAVGLPQDGPFVAPEQLDGSLSPTTAVYQVGAVAYWLLCEQSPPEAPSPQANSIPRPVRDVSPSVRSVLARALAADPADRYGSVEACYRALVDAA
jgi:hypothetical protein